METALNQQPTIEDFAAATSKVLKKAFWRKSERIAARFAELGKPMGGRSVRKMTERSQDVTRRNILENTVLLLGAARRESMKTFERVWLFLESFAQFLRGRLRVFPTLEENYAEFKYAAAAAERSWFRGDLKEFERGLIFVDHSLKGVFAKLQLID